MPAVHISDLRKHFLERGECVAVLGRNGSGKSTRSG
jgi:ABC-type multidrug transport system ATPase subunit